MRTIFFGTPQFSAEILKDLVEKGLNIVAIITQPDQASGRHLISHPPAVKKMAQKLDLNVPILQPQKIKDPSFKALIEPLKADLFVVVAFGQIFPESLLSMPKMGCVNVHTSLLPKYRGAAPIERALMAGETKTGVSIMYMVKALDAGDVLATRTVDITPHMNALELTIALCQASKDLLYPTLIKLSQGQIKPKPQNESEVTYAPKVTPKDAQIFWNKPAVDIVNQFRGVTPKPGAWCWVTIRNKSYRLKLIELYFSPLSGHPGAVIVYESGGIIVGAQENAVKITQLQLEGKKVMAAHDFIKGYGEKDVSFESCNSFELNS